jgi:CheY-like chemotaxis protein
VETLRTILVVDDLAMPVVSGWELVGIISRYYRLSRIPLLIVSAWPDPSRDHRAVGGYIQKPYEAGALLDRVRSLLPAE